MDSKKFKNDIQFLYTYLNDIDFSDVIWGFACLSRQNYKINMPRDTLDEVTYGLYYDKDGFGCLMEVVMAWETLSGETVPFLRAFSESFLLISCPTHQEIIRELASKKKEYFSPEDFSRLLISHGFADWSDKPLPDIKEEENYAECMG